MSEVYTIAAGNNAAVFAILLGSVVFAVLMVSQVLVRSSNGRKAEKDHEQRLAKVEMERRRRERVIKKNVARSLAAALSSGAAALSKPRPRKRSIGRLELAIASLGNSKRRAGDWFKVHEIIDGDTIDAWNKKSGRIRFRLSGIDAPERGQPDWEMARDWLRRHLDFKLVFIETCGKGSHDRYLGRITLGKESVEYQMVLLGLAWHDGNHCPDRSDLAAAQENAQLNRRGIWAADRPVPPWHWRRMSKAERDQFR